MLRQKLGAWAVLRRLLLLLEWPILHCLSNIILCIAKVYYYWKKNNSMHAHYSIKSYSKSNLTTVKLFFPLVNEKCMRPGT